MSFPGHSYTSSVPPVLLVQLGTQNNISKAFKHASAGWGGGAGGSGGCGTKATQICWNNPSRSTPGKSPPDQTKALLPHLAARICFRLIALLIAGSSFPRASQSHGSPPLGKALGTFPWVLMEILNAIVQLPHCCSIFFFLF